MKKKLFENVGGNTFKMGPLDPADDDMGDFTESVDKLSNSLKYFYKTAMEHGSTEGITKIVEYVNKLHILVRQESGKLETVDLPDERPPQPTR